MTVDTVDTVGTGDNGTVTFAVNGQDVTVPTDGTLLTALRERIPDLVSVKDGCAPQGQCGCCTVWVDGEPRVSCVTPVARVRGRQVTTLEGVDENVRTAWSEALCATGGSQCGFCTPGIIMRLAAKIPGSRDTELRDTQLRDTELRDTVNNALLAHVCRCTGWQTIHEAAVIVAGKTPQSGAEPDRDDDRASRRATIEGGAPQIVGPQVALGEGGFADDVAPPGSLVAVLAPGSLDPGLVTSWITGDDPSSARRAAGAIQGRKSTVSVSWPIDFPDDAGVGESINGTSFTRTLRTTWVEPGYLEPDAVWCVPGGVPVGPLKNGGAFGGKVTGDGRGNSRDNSRGNSLASELRDVARRLADEHRRPVRVLLSREDVVRHAPKRPPMALAVRADGSGAVWVARTLGGRELIQSFAPNWDYHEVDVPGLPTSLSLRGALWAEIAVMQSSVRDSHSDHSLYTDHVVAPNGAQAWAGVKRTDTEITEIHIRVRCGEVLDATVLRSYCIGAAHMALGWVRSEGIAVDELGQPLDLTMRSFGILRAVETPRVEVVIDHDHDPVNGSDAVFATVAAAVWRADGFPPVWPTARVK